jgi:pimeloyl-ACP methyl ester carboxylesterase
MLALADSMAAVGMAVVAIDLPMHGLTGNETDGTENFYRNATLNTPERTFDLDLITNTTGASGPDTITDPSGTHFINLNNLLNTRDNVRQAVSDLFTLTYALDGMSAGDASFDTSKIYFIGHSLGAMVGTPFLALEPSILDAALVFGGNSLPKILDGSASFSPQVVAGLAAVGVNKGTADYESFLGAAQTVVDSADPVNYSSAAATERGLLFFEIVGGNSGSPSDLVVPNTVPDTNDSGSTVPAPLAGTEPQLALMGLTQVNSDQTGSDLKHSIKLLVGNHASLLTDAADAYNDQPTNSAVRTEIQTIIAKFLASDGALVDVNDSSASTLLQAP